MSDLYPKIHSPFKRHTEGPQRNNLDPTRWARPEFQLLAGLRWEWTEKVDGTNVRVIWDGYKVTFGGRTDNAQMPATLLTVLRELFPETLLEQQFGASPAVLYGEGYGAKIQNGGRYRPDQGFVLFDVKVGEWWLLRDAVEDVAAKMSLDVVPIQMRGSIEAAIEAVSEGIVSAWDVSLTAEGLVGRPPLGITARDGDRLMVKVKTEDFRVT